MAKTNITFPVGRIVMGSLYNPNTTDAEGKPLVTKHGPNAGQPRSNYFFALAIPKNAGETHWAQTPWGQQIWAIGHQAFPNVAQSPSFAWKIEDGDSQIPNKNGRKNSDTEGFAGCWVVKFSGGFAPKVYQQEGSGYVQVTQADFCKPGYYVEVAGSVDGNGSAQQPGIYINHSMVCFRAYGPEITFGPDVTSAGFGQAPLPAGASMTPPAGAIPMPSAAAPTAPAPAMPSGVPTVPGVPAPLAPAGSVPTPPAVAPTAVVPNMQFAQMPAAPAAPAAPVGRQMTAAANGIPYESYVQQGWTDAMLVQNGMMLA